MNDIRADQLATIHRLASDFSAKLEADGFQRSAIASVLTALGINLATSCNDPGALALVIEAALREMRPRREKANSLIMRKNALDRGDPVSVEELSNELGRGRAVEWPDDRSKGAEDKVVVERVQYQAGAVRANGALVWNDQISGKRPLLLVMPNWLGVTDIAIKRAANIAGDKYIALVGDMYGDGRTSSGPPESQELMMSVRADRVEGRKRVVAALDTLIGESEKRGIGDATRKAAIGFCFGGGNVLELARTGADVNAVVCLHGDLATTMRAMKGDIKSAVFVIHGSKDPVAPKADRDALEAELDGAEANWQMLDFGGRLHSFSEEETKMAGVAEYHPGAAHQTYRMLDNFIQDAFAGRL